MPRLFFAVETPPDLKAELIKLQQSLEDRFQEFRAIPNFKREKLVNSHCTIRFLGNVEESKVNIIEEAVSRAIAKARIQAFECALSKTGVFPNPNYARVFWIGLTPEEPFQKIQQAIDTGLEAVEIPFEAEHSFHPHLTLFRFRERYRFPKDFEFPDLSSTTAPKLVSEIVLIESKTLPEGPVHTVRERFRMS